MSIVLEKWLPTSALRKVLTQDYILCISTSELELPTQVLVEIKIIEGGQKRCKEGTKKKWKSIFLPAFGVCSTQTLVEIYNRLVLTKLETVGGWETLFRDSTCIQLLVFLGRNGSLKYCWYSHPNKDFIGKTIG